MSESSFAHDARPAATAAEISALMRRIYVSGGLVFRKLQHYRPYICPFEVLLRHVPRNSRVLDVGCGGGLWLHLLAATGRVREALGFDSSARSIDLARQARRIDDGTAHLEFRVLDVRAGWPDGAWDVVSMIDVMHHVPTGKQREVFELAAARVASGGVFVYKDMCRRPRWRAWMNRLHDLVMAGQWIAYRDVKDADEWAAAAGLRVEAAGFFARWWYGHELRVYRRPIGRTAQESA